MLPPVDCRFGPAPRRLVLVLGLGLLLAGQAAAQPDADVSVSAQAQPAEVGTAGTVTFTIEVRGVALSDIETPEPPPTTNLALQEATPRTRREVSFDSGGLTRRVTFEWTYKPMRIGIGRIRPVDVRVQGERYTTDEIRIRIVPQSQRSQRVPRPHADPAVPSGSGGDARRRGLAPRDLFIRATASTDTAYQNEQVTAEYRLFFRPGVRLRQSRMADAWDAPGFWREELDVASRPTPRTTEMYDQTYKTIVLKRVALFPTRTGRLEIDPLRIETEAQARPRLGERGNTVPRSRYEPVTLSSEQLEVTAQPLPPGPPPDFDGAVGQFALETQVGTDSVMVGEAVELTARIRGGGNIATVSPPVLDPPSDFETYDPSVTTEIDRSGSTIRGTKTFTYTLVPRSNGRYTLPPVRFAFFDPEAEEYRTLRSGPKTVRVTGDVLPRATSQTGEGLPIGDIAGPLDEADRWVRIDRPPLHAQPWAYAALLIPIVLAAGGVAYRRRRGAGGPQAEEEADDPTAVQAHLREARRHLRDRNPRLFYRAVERSVLSFLEERLDLPRSASGMTGEALDRHLARRGTDLSVRRALHEVLSACNEAQFAPADPSPDAMHTTFDDAQHLLRRLDEALST